MHPHLDGAGWDDASWLWWESPGLGWMSWKHAVCAVHMLCMMHMLLQGARTVHTLCTRYAHAAHAICECGSSSEPVQVFCVPNIPVSSERFPSWINECSM